MSVRLSCNKIDSVCLSSGVMRGLMAMPWNWDRFFRFATQVSYVRIEAGKGRFAVWQVCDYIVTPRTIYHALAM